jgi:hypothetical protein
MRKQSFLLGYLFLGITFLAHSQTPVMLVHSKGKVKYLSNANATHSPVTSGATLKNTGSLTIGKNASAVLLCNGQFATVNTPGNFPLQKTCDEASKQLGFEYYFGNTLSAAMEYAAYADKKGYSWVKGITQSKSSGDGWASGVPEGKGSSSGWGSGVPEGKGSSSGWGTGVPEGKGSSSGWGTGVPEGKGSSSGWGSSGGNIQLILPVETLAAEKTTFSWSRPHKNSNYSLEITDGNNNSLFKVNTADSTYVLNLASLGLKEGATFSWKVTDANQPESNSGTFTCKIGSEAEKMEALSKASKIKVLKTSHDPILQKLAEAIALEDAHWYYAASEIYKNTPKGKSNNLFKMMHAAFWARHGFELLSQSAAAGN